MAIAMKCDNCGRLFEDIRDKHNHVRFAYYNGACYDYDSKDCMDLCPKCIYAVRVALNERRNKSKEVEENGLL